MSSLKKFTKAATLLSFAALSCASLLADTYTVQVNAGTGCSNIETGNAFAFCQVNVIANGIQSYGSVGMQQVGANSTTQVLALQWNTSSATPFGFTYKLSISSLPSGTYQIQTPTGTLLLATVNGFLNYQYSFSSNTSGSGTIIITPAPAVANFLSSDFSTEGTWTGKYGTTGYMIAGDASCLPLFASVTLSGASLNTWANPTTDTRGLQVSPGAASRIAAQWYSATSLSFAINLTDGNPHNVSVYLLDWTGGRNQTVTVTDAHSGAVLDRESLNSFTFGRFFTWQLQGSVVITVSLNSGANATVSGLFFQ